MKDKLTAYLSWITTGLVSAALIIVIIFFSKRIDFIMQEANDMFDLNSSREQFYIEWRERSARQSQNEHVKALYFNYASEIIRQHYLKKPSAALRRMRPDEIYDLLDTIYNYASSNVFPTANFPDGLFLPLAFACVETDFYPESEGEDGERSIFQFMDYTARSVYYENGRPFVDCFWQSPQECVWLWFNYHRKLSINFIHEDKEQEIRWTALAYNAGLHRNRLLPSFQKGLSIELYLREYPLLKGSAGYNRRVYEIFTKYKEGFGAL